MLRAVAERMQASMRPGDIVGRFGGDEFIVVVRGADERTDASVVERLRGALAEPVVWPGGGWSPMASIGVARGFPATTPPPSWPGPITRCSPRSASTRP